MGSEESKEKEDEVVHDDPSVRSNGSNCATAAQVFRPFRPDVCPRYEPGAYDEANENARRRYADEIWHSVSTHVAAK